MGNEENKELSFVENFRNALENTLIVFIDFIFEFLWPWLKTNGLWIVLRIIWVAGMCGCITQLVA